MIAPGNGSSERWLSPVRPSSTRIRDLLNWNQCKILVPIAVLSLSTARGVVPASRGSGSHSTGRACATRLSSRNRWHGLREWRISSPIGWAAHGRRAMKTDTKRTTREAIGCFLALVLGAIMCLGVMRILVLAMIQRQRVDQSEWWRSIFLWVSHLPRAGLRHLAHVPVRHPAKRRKARESPERDCRVPWNLAAKRSHVKADCRRSRALGITGSTRSHWRSCDDGAPPGRVFDKSSMSR